MTRYRKWEEGDLQFVATFVGAFVLLLVIAVVVTSLVQARRRTQRSARGMLNVRPRKIGDVAEGEVARLTGRVEADGELLTAPLSGRPCVAYVAEVWEHEGLSPTLLVMDSRQGSFALREKTGTARPAEGAVLELVFDHEGERRVPSSKHAAREGVPPLPPEVARMVESQPDSAAMDQRDYTWREGILAPGEIAAVTGKCRRTSEAEGYRGPSMRHVVVEAHEHGPARVTDERAVTLAEVGRGRS